MSTSATSTPSAFALSKLARLGRISQIAYVPDDIDRSLRHWTEVMGVGPFLRIDHVQTSGGKYMGNDADIDFTAAVGFWGDMQIELIRQNNDTPSIYKGWKNSPDGDRVHHTCLTVEDLTHACSVVEQSGCKVVQEGTLVGGTRFVYAQLGDTGPAQYLEIVQVTDATRQMMAWLHDAARTWDGRDPIRSRP